MKLIKLTKGFFTNLLSRRKQELIEELIGEVEKKFKYRWDIKNTVKSRELGKSVAWEMGFLTAVKMLNDDILHILKEEK